MRNDLKAMLWKEWREHILQYGSLNKWLLNMAMIIGLIGIFLPLQFGRTAVEGVTLLVWLWIPLLTVSSSITDAIAGERERHTLETLLASRLSDEAILVGKIAVPVLQSWINMLLAALLALVTVNIANRDSQFILYPVPVVFALLVIPLVAGLLMAGIGVIASTHAATVRQAYQRMIIPFFGIAVIPTAVISFLPENILNKFYSPEFAQTGLMGFVSIITLVLILLDVLVLNFSFKRFERSRLITG